MIFSFQTLERTFKTTERPFRSIERTFRGLERRFKANALIPDRDRSDRRRGVPGLGSLADSAGSR